MVRTAVPQNLELTDILPSGKKESCLEKEGPRNNGSKMDRGDLRGRESLLIIALQGQ